MKYNLFVKFYDGEIMLLCSGISQLDACRAAEAINKDFEAMGTESRVYFEPAK